MTPSVRNILVLLVALFSTWLADASTLTFIKSADGKTISCMDSRDENKIGYRLLNPQIEILSDGVAQLRFDQEYVQCTKKSDGSFGFINIPLTTSYDTRRIDRNGNTVVITKSYEDLYLMVINDFYKRVLYEPLSSRTAPLNSYNVEFDILDALRDPQDEDALNKGAKVAARLEFMMIANRSFTSVDGGAKAPSGKYAWGSFFLNFEVSKSTSGFELSRITLK